MHSFSLFILSLTYSNFTLQHSNISSPITAIFSIQEVCPNRPHALYTSTDEDVSPAGFTTVFLRQICSTQDLVLRWISTSLRVSPGHLKVTRIACRARNLYNRLWTSDDVLIVLSRSGDAYSLA